MLTDGITIGCCLTISYYPADEFLLAFFVNFIISFSIGCGSGLDNKIPAQQQAVNDRRLQENDWL